MSTVGSAAKGASSAALRKPTLREVDVGAPGENSATPVGPRSRPMQWTHEDIHAILSLSATDHLASNSAMRDSACKLLRRFTLWRAAHRSPLEQPCGHLPNTRCRFAAIQVLDVCATNKSVRIRSDRLVFGIARSRCWRTSTRPFLVFLLFERTLAAALLQVPPDLAKSTTLWLCRRIRGGGKVAWRYRAEVRDSGTAVRRAIAHRKRQWSHTASGTPGHSGGATHAIAKPDG